MGRRGGGAIWGRSEERKEVTKSRRSLDSTKSQLGTKEHVYRITSIENTLYTYTQLFMKKISWWCLLLDSVIWL